MSSSKPVALAGPKGLALLMSVVVVCVAVLLPWYGRAYVTTGSATFPMHPAASDTFLSPEQRHLWSGAILQPDLARVTRLFEQVYAYSRDRFNDATNPTLVILLPVMVVAGLRFRNRMPAGVGLLIAVVISYLISLAIVSLFFAPGVRTNSSSVWAAGHYRTFLYPAHGSLLIAGAMACAAVGLGRRGTIALGASSIFMLLSQTVDLTAYVRWSAPSFLGMQAVDGYLAEFHSLGADLVAARHVLSDDDRVALDRHRTQINVPGRITPTTRLLGPVYSTARTLEPPARCDGPSDLTRWLAEHQLDAIVTAVETCREAARWPRDDGLDVTVGKQLVIARRSGRGW